MVLPGLLPVLAFALGFLDLGNVRPVWSWDRCFLRGAVFFGAYAVVGAELLGLVHALTLPALLILWLSPILVLGTQLEVGMLILLSLFLLTTGVVAYLAPPDTWDSLTYHMARVAHWAQSGSLAHYATGIERQDLMPPGAELGMLHAYILP
jgi:hypothetical protein